MREIVLDTETTGLDPVAGHRVVEIACVELVNHLPTDRHFHVYFNPERDMPEEAFRVHGLSLDFLSQHGLFADKAQEFEDFLGDAPLIIHNAEFDLKFLDHELRRCGRRIIDRSRGIVDTVMMARRRFPGSPASLDALCRRFEIDLSARSKHSAKLDCELLALVYLELIGGREPGLDLAAAARQRAAAAAGSRPARTLLPPRPHAPSDEELAAHVMFLKKLKEPIWAS
jgi:DNA polymerase-3 subunit epsilon